MAELEVAAWWTDEGRSLISGIDDAIAQWHRGNESIPLAEWIARWLLRGGYLGDVPVVGGIR